MIRAIIVTLLVIVCSQAVLAREYYIVKDINEIFTPTPAKTANAMCFMYPNNHFKCACRFSDNSKLWTSKEISKIRGLTEDVRYGSIDACKKNKER